MTLYHVFANRSNIGDWMSARAIQSQLPAHLPLRELYCDEHYVADMLKILPELGADDALVIGGGGLFMDYFLPLWEGVRRIVDKTQVFIWGVGYCDSKHRASRPPTDLLREIAAASRLCMVRDELTARLLAHSPAPLLAPVICPSVLLIKPPAAKKPLLLHAVHYETTGHERYETLCEATRAFASATGRGYHETNNEIEPASEKELAANLRDYANADLVVSTRLHGCIIGLASGCRVIAMSGDRKVEAFMQAAGLGDWVCELGDMGRLDKLMAVSSDQPGRQDFIEQGRQQNREIGQTISAMLADLQPAKET
jgi:polysaccharide pyruvyl transferase WcaK-like protein